MIQASELRLGISWIESYFVFHDGVSQISERPIKRLQVSLEDLKIISESKGFATYRPIPLTHEILLACGFEKHKNSNEYWTFWKLNNGWHICESHHDEPSAGVENGCFHYGEDYQKITSLHQLQNLYFALTNTELNYKP